MRLDKWLIVRRDETAAGAGGAGGAAGAGAAGGQGEGASDAGKAAAGAASGAQDWRSGWADDLKGDATLSRFKTSDELAKSYLEARRTIGKTVTTIPGKDAKPEEVAAFREKVLGIPSDIAKYREAVKLPTIEGVAWDQKALEGFTALAHKEGIPPGAIPALASWFAQHQQGSQQRMVGQWVKEQGALEDEWGADYDAKVQAGKTGFAFYDQAAEGRLSQIFKASGLDRNPDVLRMFVHLGELLHEHGFIEGELKEGAGMEDLRAQVAAIENDKNHPAMNREHPNYRKEYERYTGLLKKLHGTRSA